MRGLIKIEVSTVIGAGKLARNLPLAILVLKLGVFPLPVGGDGGQLNATQIPINLRRHARVGVLHLGRFVAEDLAVLWACHHWQNRGGDQRISGHNPGRKSCRGGVDDHARGRGVFGLHVVGQQRYFQIAVGRQIEPTPNAGTVIAVDRGAIKRIGHVAIKFTRHGGDGAQRHALRKLARGTQTNALLVALKKAHLHVALCGFGRCPAHDIDNASRCIFAKQRTLGAAQDFHPVNVEQIHRRLAGSRCHDTIQYRGHGRLNPWRCRNGADTANEQRRVFVRGVGTEIHRGGLCRHRAQGVDIAFFKRRPVDHRDGNRRGLQELGSLGCRDDHSLQFARFRCGRCLLCKRGQGRQQGDDQRQAMAWASEG